MGRRTNPTILRLGKTQNWKSKYLEKKTSETSEYTFKDLEIRKFISKIFNDNGLVVKNCKINLSSEGYTHIFISYYMTLKSIFLINNINSRQKIEFYKNLQTNKHFELKLNVKNYAIYNGLNKNTLNENLTFRSFKNIIKNKVISKKVRRVNLIKYYKNYLIIKNFKKPVNINMNSFSEQIVKSLKLFLGKDEKILMTVRQLNKNLKFNLSQEEVRFLKKSLIKLKKYNQNDFLKEGVNTLFITLTQPQSSKLLAHFISTQLTKLKRHNFFIKFLKNTLTILRNNKFSSVKGIKIKIKGRFNGTPRAKDKIIYIGESMPIITQSSYIDYSESTSYTLNGTFGVKVWIHYKNF
jgi:ribosomal protein S3